MHGTVDREVSAKACAEELLALADATQVRGLEARAAEDTCILWRGSQGFGSLCEADSLQMLTLMLHLSRPQNRPRQRPATSSHKSYCVDEMSKATEKKMDLQSQVETHSSNVGAAVSKSSVLDCGVAELQAERKI